jgi:hypothetical protein
MRKDGNMNAIGIKDIHAALAGLNAIEKEAEGAKLALAKHPHATHSSLAAIGVGRGRPELSVHDLVDIARLEAKAHATANCRQAAASAKRLLQQLANELSEPALMRQ